MLLKYFPTVQQKKGWDLCVDSQPEAKCRPAAVIARGGKGLQGERMCVGGEQICPLAEGDLRKNEGWGMGEGLLRSYNLLPGPFW